VKNLIYANSPRRARRVLSWTRALGDRFPLEMTVQRVEGGDPAKEEAARLLEAGLAELPNVVSVSVSSRRGAPEEIIAAEVREKDYDLVTLSPAGRQGFNRLFHGSMIAHVVQRVSTTVLAVRDGERIPPRRVLACVSGSRHSLTTVTLAAQIAGIFDAELTLLLVLSQLGIGVAGGAAWEADPGSFMESGEPLAGHLRVAAQVAAHAGTTPAIRVRQGLVNEEILREIRGGGHDLLVIGTHRAEGFDTVYEDLTDELVRKSPISTMIVGMRAGLL
jgi:nucleotide-binding universal stress UspA family protein